MSTLDHLRPALGATAATTARWGVAAGLTGWLGLTLAQQTGRARRLVAAVDPTGIVVPDWRFFAPNPAVHEYRLLVRDRLDDETVTDWEDLMVTHTRRHRHAVWSPQRRMEKGLFDATAALFATARSAGGSGPAESWPVVRSSPAYLALLNHVTHRVTHHPRAAATQFLIARTATYEPDVLPDPVLTSEMHAVAPGGAQQRQEAAR